MTDGDVTEAASVEVVKPQQVESVDSRLTDELVGRARIDGPRLTV
ncbi:hypothetical protein ACFV4Q_06050 [Streptomyces nojiriensis]